MPIPESPRVIYGVPALEEVICQVKFPSILRIGSEAPADFQNIVRRQFPLFEEKDQVLPEGLPPQIAEIMSIDLKAKSKGKAYNFISEERDWTVSLTRDFLALSTTNYSRWEDFRAHLDEPLRALHETYEPSFYTRIGLRYRDVIIPSKFGLDGVPWTELLKPFAAGALSEESVMDEVNESESGFKISLGEGVGEVQVKHFLAKVRGTDEPCYVIDADYFTNIQTEINDAIEKLNVLNSFAGRLFRWFITDRLHNAMEPNQVT